MCDHVEFLFNFLIDLKLLIFFCWKANIAYSKFHTYVIKLFLQILSTAKINHNKKESHRVGILSCAFFQHIYISLDRILRLNFY